MARIRTIKPEFAQSESVGKISRDARLLFIQLWTIADDFGRCRAAHQYLVGQLYPYDADALKQIGKWLVELADGGFVRLYCVDGNSYLDIPGWGKHQRIDNAGKSNIPECRGECSDARREPPRTAASLGEPPLDLGPRKGPRKYIWPEDFRERFWREYPLRKGKAAALRVLEAIHDGDGVPFERLIIAVQKYASTADPKFTKHPKTWLNGGCWDDEYAHDPIESPISDDERDRMFAELRNGRLEKEGNDLLGAGSGAHQKIGEGRQEPAAIADDQTRKRGMVSLGNILSESSGLHAGSDEDDKGSTDGVHGSGRLAG